MLKLLLSAIYKYNKLKCGEYPLSILYYHHVFPETEPYHPDDLCAQDFTLQITYLKKYFNIMSLDKAVELQKQKALPPKSLVITFDDGYLDNYTVARPILEKLNCPASFFIASEGVEKGYLWNDVIEQSIKRTSNKAISANIIGITLEIATEQQKQQAFHQLINHLKFLNNEQRQQTLALLTDELNISTFSQTMMNKEQIFNLHQSGFTIGAHTHSHTILSTEQDNISNNELITNKHYLEKTINHPIKFLAYPNGLYGRDFTNEHCQMVKSLNFEAAFSTNDGGSISTSNIFKIPRFMPYRKKLPLFALSIAKIAGEHV